MNWVGRYQTRYDLQITVELNTPYQNRVDRAGGFFVKDIDSGQVYLMHSGRIGGGTKGVGRLAFLTWLDEVPDEVVDASGHFKDGFIVMPVQGVGAAASLKRYLEKIAEFKEWVRTGAAGTPSFERKQQKFLAYYKEARGRRKGRRSAKIDYVSRHGDVVDRLNAWRSGHPVPKGQAIVKNALIDLGVGTENALSEIFEVKTSCCRGDLYTAIGQLMVHGSSSSCKRHLVIPNEVDALPNDILLTLKLQDIQVIRYDLKPRSVELLI
ncbi:hypothetical protein J1M35_18265 [Ottowia testudinis]|uniref:Uncharacterized protein n=1 Tax=Ottowia testudinis TaxID=2816950 RepID=A0A975CJ87_9BURK|nr:hypothetical protein J1M35_18265 [Ottowia testudinis]